MTQHGNAKGGGGGTRLPGNIPRLGLWQIPLAPTRWDSKLQGLAASQYSSVTKETCCSLASEGEQPILTDFGDLRPTSQRRQCGRLPDCGKQAVNEFLETRHFFSQRRKEGAS
ncbi:unnamed protein product [Pleuronectes platessa]|uniref:Uncharacterized protein n=1 Tax=Pleuronectes platessa TaxID=8262 RepID=A0A9N7YTV7_PLEPL|nr:unnamed protein product [Pleuronectes platessa]